MVVQKHGLSKWDMVGDTLQSQFLSVKVSQLGERNISSSVSVSETCGAKLWVWTGPLSSTAGRTSLTRLAARGSWGLLYRNNETRYQWSHPPLPFIHPKRLWVALATCALGVCMCVSVHERGPEKPQSENYVSSERIRSPRFSQGLGILLLSCLRVLFNVNTHIHSWKQSRTHTYSLCESEMRSTKAEADDKEDWNWFSSCNLRQICNRFSDRKQPERTNLSAQGSVWMCWGNRVSGSKVLSVFSSHSVSKLSIFLPTSK